MRAGRGIGGWAVLALAAFAASVTSAAAQSPAGPTPPAGASDTIATNDELAATAGAAPSGSPTAPAPFSQAPGEPVRPAPAKSSTFDRFASWIGVDSESAQWLRLGTWEGNLGFDYNGSTLDIGNSSAGEARSTTRIAAETLTIRNQGFSIFDPRLISGSAGVTLGLDQVKQQFDGQEQRQRGTLDGYSFDATFLGEKPLYARTWADRIQGYSNLSFGGTTKNTESTVGASLNLRQDSWFRDADILPFFDASLQVYQQHTLQQFSSEGTTAADDQVQHVVSLNAHNGTETSDLYVLLQYVDFDYLSYSPGSYHSRGAALNYSGDFGANLDTTWTSAIGYNDRNGDVPLETFQVNESVDVHHSSDFQSSYAYNLYQQDGAGGNVRNQSASANLTYTLWQNLTLTAGADGAYSQVSNGTVEGLTGSVGIDYHRNLSAGGSVFGNAQGNFTHASNNVASGNISVIDEAHSAPSVLGVGNGFALNNPFVLADSIVLVDTRGGARIPTTVNVDYTITTDGNNTRILMLPTSHVIQPNDPLAVSYAYEIPAQANYNTSNVALTVGADVGWFAFSYNHTQTNAPEVVSGGVALVGNTRSDEVTTALRGDWEALKANVGANVLRFDSASLAYVNQSYSAGIGYQPYYAFSVNFNGAWSRANYSVPERRSGNVNGRVDINFYAPPSARYDVLSTTLFALHNKLTDSEVPTQTLNQYGATLNYTLGKLTLIAGAQYGDFVFGSSTTKSVQFNLSANRRF